MPVSIITILFISLFSLLSCNKSNADVGESQFCKIDSLKNNLSYTQLMQSFDAEVINALVEQPAINGAMGRNKQGYFHVRFQIGISSITNYILYKGNSIPALEQYTKALEYSFSFQKTEGDFQLNIPADLQYLGTPTSGDITSGIAFFMASVGVSLMSLEQNTWYKNSPEALPYKTRIEQLKPSMLKAVNYLILKKDLLQNYDKDAPNRLLFDAQAFYLTGKYLNEPMAQQLGMEFINRALSSKTSQGYFIEKGGYDSSYNGVSIQLLFTLFAFLPNQEAIKNEIWNAVSCSVNWQSTRILNSGEISTQGNSRVFPGGEQFLGNEKKLASKDVILGFYCMYYFSGNYKFKELAERVRIFYQ